MQVDDNLTMDESAERNFTVTEPSLVSMYVYELQTDVAYRCCQNLILVVRNSKLRGRDFGGNILISYICQPITSRALSL